MAINFDKLFGVHPQMLNIRGKRTELLAGNLANADTPGYKAKDIDFKTVFKSAQSHVAPVHMDVTQTNHIMPDSHLAQGQIKYRIPTQPSIDGNTVENQIEQAKYTENALRYQASLRFLTGKISGIMTALRGE